MNHNWALLSICGEGMLNAGNLLVEQCALSHLPPPVRTFSVFKPPTTSDLASIQSNGCQLVLCTGTTLLTRGGSHFWRWVEALEPLSVPVAMSGGCFWNRHSDEADIILPSHAQLSIRDPYSLRVCRRHGFDYPLVGCPSLLLAEHAAERKGGDYLLAGFHRHGRERQSGLFQEIGEREQRPLRILIQEKDERSVAVDLAKRTQGEVIELVELRSSKDWLSVFQGVHRCLSGRLHQVLPAAALGIPAALLLPDRAAAIDSRYSLLRHLGVPLHVVGVDDDGCLAPQRAHASKLQELVAALKSWLKALLANPRQRPRARAVPTTPRHYLELEQTLSTAIRDHESLLQDHQALTQSADNLRERAGQQQARIRELQDTLRKYRGDAERKNELIQQLRYALQEVQGDSAVTNVRSAQQ